MTTYCPFDVRRIIVTQLLRGGLLDDLPLGVLHSNGHGTPTTPHYITCAPLPNDCASLGVRRRTINVASSGARRTLYGFWGQEWSSFSYHPETLIVL